MMEFLQEEEEYRRYMIKSLLDKGLIYTARVYKWTYNLSKEDLNKEFKYDGRIIERFWLISPDFNNMYIEDRYGNQAEIIFNTQQELEEFIKKTFFLKEIREEKFKKLGI